MKKIICLSVLLLASAISIVSQKAQQSKVSLALKPLPHKVKLANAPIPQLKVMNDEASVGTMTEIENDYNNLTEKELNSEITKNKELERNAQLILKANQGSLSGTESKHLLKYVRTNSVLHQLLLEKQLQDLEERI